VTYRLTVNGSEVEIDAPGMRRLLDALRKLAPELQRLKGATA